MHDHTASTVALARTMLMAVDVSRETTEVRTASLKLVLDTLIELGDAAPSPLPTAKGAGRQALADSARRTVAGHIAEFSDAEEPRRGPR